MIAHFIPKEAEHLDHSQYDGLKHLHDQPRHRARHHRVDPTARENIHHEYGCDDLGDAVMMMVGFFWYKGCHMGQEHQKGIR